MDEKQTFDDTNALDPQAQEALQEASMEQVLSEKYGAEPLDAPEEPPKKKRERKPKAPQGASRKRGGAILSVVLGLVVALLILGGAGLYWILNRPQDLFEEVVTNVTEAPKAERMEAAFDLSGFATPAPTDTPAPTQAPAPTEAPAGQLILQTPVPTEAPVPAQTPTPGSTPVTEVQDNIVNILLLGIDAFEDGGTTSGTEPHTDVIMVLAINFDKDTVDMISIPRDTFTTAPGYHGFYKLNGVFNAGGGMDDMEGGIDLIRQAVEIWLGGISITYYYALDFQAVIDIVDAIGGIDYDLDIPISYEYAFEKKAYSPGWQHLDGNAVMGYLRVRHGVTDSLDSNRTARQRRMLMAIYDKLRNEGKLSQIPELINAATSGIYTNTTLAQTTALANYAMNTIGPEKIRTRSMEGDIWYQHYFKYCFVDQQKRIDLIKEVYGLDATPIGVNTPQYENWLYDIGFLSMKYVRQPEKVFQVIQTMKDQGYAFTDEQIALYAACYHAYAALDEGFRECSERMQKAYVDTSLSEAQIEALKREVKARLESLNEAVKKTTLALRDGCDIHLKLEWTVSERWFVDPDINEKFVAFG